MRSLIRIAIIVLLVGFLISQLFAQHGRYERHGRDDNYRHGRYHAITAAEADAFSNTYSVIFDGVDDFVDVSDAASLQFGTGSYTMSLWFKTADVAQNAVSMGRRDLNPEYSLSWMRLTDGAGGAGKKIGVLHYGPTGAGFRFYYVTDANVVDGGWHHVVCVVNYGTGIVIYIDGSPVAATDIVGGGVWETSDNNMPLGVGSSGNGYSPSAATIDEVAIWNTAMDADAVTAIYNAGVPIDLATNSGDYDITTNLQMYLRMGDDDAYPNLLDNSTNSNTGVMTNMESGDIVEDTP